MLLMLLLLLMILLLMLLVSSMRARPIPFVLFGCSHECCEFVDKVFGFLLLLLLLKDLLSTTQKELAKAENAFVSRIEVGLIIGSFTVEEGADDEVEEEVKKHLKNFGELKKYEVGFVDFSGEIHELLL